MNPLVFGSSTYIAALVEMVEALTIVLAIGVSREWRSTFYGMVSAMLTLTLITAIFGPAIARVPIGELWVIMGTLLLILGMQWLRKAILRFGGLKALHDEDELYKQTLVVARRAGRQGRLGLDWYAFTVVYKGVFLEGLEVVLIVLSFGSTQSNIGLGVQSAVAAFVTVIVLGILLHRPLARVPENAMKYLVGVVLTTFGTFFASKGVNIVWPNGNVALLEIGAFYLVVSVVLVWWLRTAQRPLNPQKVRR